MAENQLPEEVVQKLDPNRRKFILGVLAAGIAAPSVASFVLGKANKSTFTGNAIRPASIVDASGNFKFSYFDPSGNYPNVSANYMYENMSGNFLRDNSGNFAMDLSGNLLCGTSGNILIDDSGNAVLSGNSYVLNPSGNWSFDGNGDIYLNQADGNPSWVAFDPSGNQFIDTNFPYDQDGLVNFDTSGNQGMGLACVVSANHIQGVPDSENTTTTSEAPASTTTSAPASTTTSTPAVAPSGSAVTTTAVPVIPVVPKGSIPATQ